jgi:hemerythrin superfamily protein
MMGAMDVLEQDHRVIEKQLAEFEQALSGRRDAVFSALAANLIAHTLAEEQVFYPALVPYASEAVEHAIQEHAAVKTMVERLRQMDTDQDEFEAAFNELAASVKAHIREEEEPGGLVEIAHQSLSESVVMELGERVTAVLNEWREPSAA